MSQPELDVEWQEQTEPFMGQSDEQATEVYWLGDDFPEKPPLRRSMMSDWSVAIFKAFTGRSLAYDDLLKILYREEHGDLKSRNVLLTNARAALTSDHFQREIANAGLEVHDFSFGPPSYIRKEKRFVAVPIGQPVGPEDLDESSRPSEAELLELTRLIRLNEITTRRHRESDKEWAAHYARDGRKVPKVGRIFDLLDKKVARENKLVLEQARKELKAWERQEDLEDRMITAGTTKQRKPTKPEMNTNQQPGNIKIRESQTGFLWENVPAWMHDLDKQVGEALRILSLARNRKPSPVFKPEEVIEYPLPSPEVLKGLTDAGLVSESQIQAGSMDMQTMVKAIVFRAGSKALNNDKLRDSALERIEDIVDRHIITHTDL